MPLYDCMLLFKPNVQQVALMDLVARVSRHVYSRHGVLTEMKSFGAVQLGYGIKKLDGRFYQVNTLLFRCNTLHTKKKILFLFQLFRSWLFTHSVGFVSSFFFWFLTVHCQLLLSLVNALDFFYMYFLL